MWLRSWMQRSSYVLPGDKDVSSGMLKDVLHFKLKSTCSEVKGLHLGLKYLYTLKVRF